MSEKKALCRGKTYRGVIVVTVLTDDDERQVVIGAVRGNQVRLYECDTLDEAHKLIDAALLMVGPEFVSQPQFIAAGA